MSGGSCFPLAVLCPFAYFFPKIAIFYAICGAYDVSRNKPLSLSTLRRYFIGNGFGTWVLSPFNTLLDLLSLPYINKGVYRLEDLPPAYQEEVKRLIEIAKEQNLVAQLEERAKEFPRTMIFFRWYGVNMKTIPGRSGVSSAVEVHPNHWGFSFQQEGFHLESILDICGPPCAFCTISTT